MDSALRHAMVADSPRTLAFVAATHDPERALELLEEARRTPYGFLRAAACLFAGYRLIRASRMEGAAECYLTAVECGPAAFGFGAAAGGFADRVFPNAEGVALAPHNLALFVASAKLSPETALFKRIVTWLRRDGATSACPAWRAVSLFHYGVVQCMMFKNDAAAFRLWTAASAVSDEELAGDPMGTQAKLLSVENLDRRMRRAEGGAPSAQLIESLGPNFQMVVVPRVAGACGYCGQTGAALMTCTRCLNEQYCGKDCQRRAWPAHKGACKLPARITISSSPSPA